MGSTPTLPEVLGACGSLERIGGVGTVVDGATTGESRGGSPASSSRVAGSGRFAVVGQFRWG